MKTNNRNRKSTSIAKTRWIGYAAAGAATALYGSHSAEAAIHYSGPINAVLRGDGNVGEYFSLDQPGHSIEFKHKLGDYDGFRVQSTRSVYRALRGYIQTVVLASKLGFGENISAGPFVRTSTTYWGIMASNGRPRGQFLEQGVGFIGFRFEGSGGVQYGWARVKMAGQDRNNAFKVLDFAYADPGEPIFAGQRSSDEKAPDQAVEENSLGWLALGAAGLLAWRKSRSQTAR